MKNTEPSYEAMVKEMKNQIACGDFELKACNCLVWTVCVLPIKKKKSRKRNFIKRKRGLFKK